jgi:hypothetical protein
MIKIQLVVALIVLIYMSTVCFGDQANQKGRMNHVIRECKSKLSNINSLKEFREFMEDYCYIFANKDQLKPGLLTGNVRKCFDQKEQLLELKEIISNQGDGVCRLDYIRKLVNYHLNHMIKDDNDSKEELPKDLGESKVRRAHAARIFSLYAHQVVYTCKSKLLERVRLLESKHQHGHVLKWFLPVEILKDQAGADAKFKEFLEQFKSVDDFAFTLDGIPAMDPAYEFIISSDAKSKMDELKKLCKTLEPYYKALFSPISALSQLGYDVTGTSVDSYKHDSGEFRLLKGWLATAQLCQGVLRVDFSTISSEGSSESDQPFVAIKFKEVRQADSGSVKDVSDELEMNDRIVEIAPAMVKLADKKSSLRFKLKSKWKLIRKVLMNHVKLDANENHLAAHFMDMITRSEKDLDSPVSLSGKRRETGVHTLNQMIGSDVDSIIAGIALLASHHFALVLNSCVAIGLSASFILFFSISSVAKHTKTATYLPTDLATSNENFKEHFNGEMAKHLERMKKSNERKSFQHRLSKPFYTGLHR